MSKHAKSNSIRLIAGQWRGRRLPVQDSTGLRPTTDRVRETLFNWLMHQVHGSQCLDLFAGTGALGLESLSRGAAYVQFVEANRSVAQMLNQNIELLQANRETTKAEVANQDALLFLDKTPGRQYDLVFLDPPFESELLEPAINLLHQYQWLSNRASVYIEQGGKQPPSVVPKSWTLYRQGRAGQSVYFLYHP